MFHPVFVVAVREILAGVGATRFLSVMRRFHGHLGLEQQIVELQRLDEIRIPDHRAVGHLEILPPGPDLLHHLDALGQHLAGAEDGAVVLHGALHFVAQCSGGGSAIGMTQPIQPVERPARRILGQRAGGLFGVDDLGAAVLARAEAGVDVKGIFETRGSETEYSEMGTLYCAGVPVRQDGNSRTFHHKVIVLDDETVITGSLNFSDNANSSNDENVIIVTHGEIAAQYLQEFERRWTEAAAPELADMSCESLFGELATRQFRAIHGTETN